MVNLCTLAIISLILSFAFSLPSFAQSDPRNDARRLPYDQYQPDQYGRDPHGSDPHGYPQDEQHDRNLPANAKELDQIAPDPYNSPYQR